MRIAFSAAVGQGLLAESGQGHRDLVIDIDETVVAEAMRLSGARTKREVVDRALRELVARATRPSVRELFGIGGVDLDYDPKAPWARGAEAGQSRVEQPRVQQPRGAYRVTKSPAPKSAKPTRSKKS